MSHTAQIMLRKAAIERTVRTLFHRFHGASKRRRTLPTLCVSVRSSARASSSFRRMLKTRVTTTTAR